MKAKFVNEALQLPGKSKEEIKQNLLNSKDSIISHNEHLLFKGAIKLNDLDLLKEAIIQLKDSIKKYDFNVIEDEHYEFFKLIFLNCSTQLKNFTKSFLLNYEPTGDYDFGGSKKTDFGSLVTFIGEVLNDEELFFKGINDGYSSHNFISSFYDNKNLNKKMVDWIIKNVDPSRLSNFSNKQLTHFFNRYDPQILKHIEEEKLKQDKEFERQRQIERSNKLKGLSIQEQAKIILTENFLDIAGFDVVNFSMDENFLNVEIESDYDGITKVNSNINLKSGVLNWEHVFIDTEGNEDEPITGVLNLNPPRNLDEDYFNYIIRAVESIRYSSPISDWSIDEY